MHAKAAPIFPFSPTPHPHTHKYRQPQRSPLVLSTTELWIARIKSGCFRGNGLLKPSNDHSYSGCCCSCSCSSSSPSSSCVCVCIGVCARALVRLSQRVCVCFLCLQLNVRAHAHAPPHPTPTHTHTRTHIHIHKGAFVLSKGMTWIESVSDCNKFHFRMCQKAISDSQHVRKRPIQFQVCGHF